MKDILQGLKPPFDWEINKEGDVFYFDERGQETEIGPIDVTNILNAVPALIQRVEELEKENAALSALVAEFRGK